MNEDTKLSAPDRSVKIVITGGAGLVGQNLVIRLLAEGYSDICVVDKNAVNLGILKQLNPAVEAICSDLRAGEAWEQRVRDARVLVMLHAQIGGIRPEEFHQNNVEATRSVLRALQDNPACHLIHVSSSVVNSKADDDYTRTKAEQEMLVRASPNPSCVLRPTLMFGWFDRKHFGWLSRFMKRSPVFPIPGNGNYLRQPLFVGDFCSIIVNCIEQHVSGECFNISGKQKIPYVRIIESIRKAVGSRTVLLRIPYGLFHFLLRVYALVDRNPPFTVNQLEALVIDEVFEDADWEGRFGIQATPLDEALTITFLHPLYSEIELEF